MRTMEKLFSDFDDLFKDLDQLWEDPTRLKRPQAYDEVREVREYDNGTYEVDVPGYGQDDLDVTVEDGAITFNFENDERIMTFGFKIPRNISDVVVAVDKGVLTFSLQYKPSDVSIHFQDGDSDAAPPVDDDCCGHSGCQCKA